MGDNDIPQSPKPINPQIIITYDLGVKRINIQSNVTDQNMIMGMLIDALSTINRNRMSAEQKKIVVASPSIIKPN